MERQEFAPQEPAAKPISVYNTVGSCETSFKTKAQNWRELKKDLAAKGVKYEGMKAVIGETQEELTEDTQILPQEEINLFLTPIKVRSGD